ncbi:hypothetical protein Y032_0018g3733 [Ancylostoma ceylanicum]|uniref:Uncharacterized protein n=1 Tax=Ancylostoma ceylanicum TaxID=53326 RepID=A0A016V555_9BILA|nr:hypothetical protein Y032_0018g3733 [Ancylostoma ceylanicum]
MLILDVKTTKVTEPPTKPMTTAREVTDDNNGHHPDAMVAAKHDPADKDKNEDNSTDLMPIFIFILLGIVLLIIIVVGVVLLTQHKKNMKKRESSKASKDKGKKKVTTKSTNTKSKGTPK